MNAEEREQAAVDHAFAARKELERASEHPDPVERRRGHARAAKHYLQAAMLLSDDGRLEE